MSELVKLGDYISIQKGKPPLLSPYWGRDAEIYLSPEYLRNNASGTTAKGGGDAVRVFAGDTVLLWDGSNAGEFFKAKTGLLASTMARISHSPKFRPDFFFHLLKHSQRILKNQTNGTGIPHVDKEVLETIPVFCPSLIEQGLIAQILDTLDTTIQQTEAIIQKLKQVKQGLLHDLLTRGIDANGEIRPSYDDAPHLYKESPLGWIPKEWVISTVEQEFEITTGLSLGAHRVPRFRHIPYLRVANVQRARIDTSDIAFMEATSNELLNRRIALGDLLIVEGHASTNEIGRCAIADSRVSGFTFQNHLFRLRTRRLIAEFALYWMNSSYVKNYWCKEAATSSGLNTINRTKLEKVLVVVPHDIEQSQIITFAESLSNRIQGETHSLTKLKSTKTALMDDLLTGRVCVTSLLQAEANA